MPSPLTRSTPVFRLLTELNATRISLLDEHSGQERRGQLMGRIAEYLLVSLIVLVIAGIEVGRWYFNTPPQPVWVCAFALGVTGYALLRVWLILPQVRVLSREREAMRLLRHAVQGLCGKGYVLFDGVTGPRGWSLGSVLAGPTGVFCVITRFVPRGYNLTEVVEHVDDGQLKIGAHEVMADPLEQARRAATGLYELLAANGLDTVPVQPVVVFPGWSVRKASGFDDPEVLVTGDQLLEDTIRQASGKLEPKQLIAVSMLLEKAAAKAPIHPTHADGYP
ncbi:MAG: hypothetical protein JWL81_1014 [Verrucomicrobiales bacterium]|nr:hypothetical protein [Verrucomicrobiales bacterium]